jgi:hypothetical protein
MGPYPGAAVLDGLNSGQFLASLEVCRVGDQVWTAVAQEPLFGVSQADAASASEIQRAPAHAASTDPLERPPIWHFVVLAIVGGLGLFLSVADKNLVYIGVALTFGLVYADAWIAGIRRRPNDKDASNMSAMGWATAVLLGGGILLPVYALARGRIKTRPGNAVLRIMVFIVALVPVCLLVALALWIVLPSGWQNGWTAPTPGVPIAVDPQAEGKRGVFSDDGSPECVIAKKRAAAICEGSSSIAKDFGGRTPVSKEQWIDCYTRAKRIFIENQVQTAPMGEAAKFAKCFR